MTASGGEGMVVKPLKYVVRAKKGLVQPAVKCRGPEYLRFIYGPEYDAPENLQRLPSRGLSAKRSLALSDSHSGWKHWSASPAANHCGACMSVSLASWHWKESR